MLVLNEENVDRVKLHFGAYGLAGGWASWLKPSYQTDVKRRQVHAYTARVMLEAPPQYRIIVLTSYLPCPALPPSHRLISSQ